jgi:hypothetical protein
MKPEHFDFGGGAHQTVLHPAVLIAMVFGIVLILTLPRRHCVVPFLATALLVPVGQVIFAAGVHWFVLRVLILAGCVRLLLDKARTPGKLFPHGFNTLDKLFVAWAFYRGVAAILLFQDKGAAVYQAGFWLQAFGGYFLLRYLVQDVEDVIRAAKTLAVLVVILALCMANERFRDVNIFGYAQSLSITPSIRGGLIRAQATFGTPILAGCIGATMVPLFYWLWKAGKAKLLAVAGIVASTMMVFFSASSTPALAFVSGIGALFLWPMRRWMRILRWGIVISLLGLAFVMKAPVWFVISHVNVTGSSDSYDRAMLIDTFVRHFKDWWLIGTNQTGSWGWDMFDLANQYVAEAETGGLFALVCFIAIVSKCFSRLGKMRKQIAGDKHQEWLCWSLGAVMFAHVMAYFGVSYWDQTIVWWFTSLAMISTVTASLESPWDKKSADNLDGAISSPEWLEESTEPSLAASLLALHQSPSLGDYDRA